jgi:hypothetical protein
MKMKAVKVVAVKKVEVKAVEPKVTKKDFIDAHNIKVIPFNKELQPKLDKQQVAVSLLILSSIVTGKAEVSLKMITSMAQVMYYRHNASGKATKDGSTGNRVYLVNGLKGMTEKGSCHATWVNNALTKLTTNTLVWQFSIKQFCATHGIGKAELTASIVKARNAKESPYKAFTDIMQKSA